MNYVGRVSPPNIPVPPEGATYWDYVNGNLYGSQPGSGDWVLIGGAITIPTFRLKFTVSSAQLLTMFTTPVLLIKPPNGFDIVPVMINVYFIPGPTNTPYTFVNPNENVFIGYDTAPPSQAVIYNGTYFSMNAAGFVDQIVENAQPLWIPVQGSGSFQTPGNNLYLTTQDGNLSSGDGILVGYIDYQLTPIP
jgi:hypothetical protein